MNFFAVAFIVTEAAMIASQHGYMPADKEKGTEMTWNGDRGMVYFKY